MNKNSLRNWGLVFALVLFSGIASVGLPWLRGVLAGSNHVVVPRETRPVLLPAPAALVERLPESLAAEGAVALPPAAALTLLAVVVGGAIVVTGGGLAFLSTLLVGRVEQAREDESFQAGLAAYEKKASEQVKAQQATRPTKPKPAHLMPRWSIASTSLIFVVFAVFAGTAISDTLYPGREMEFFGAMVSARGVFILGAIILTALALGLIYRPQLVALSRTSDDEASTAAIPWDTIYVVFTGMIFIAIGVGLVLWLRSAPVG